MKSGKAFEIFVKRILINIGFAEVKSDGLFVYDASPGQMIQGLGEAHNADVLLEPPVQTPFFYKTKLLIECKDYNKAVGLATVRGVLGLREDINHFEIVDVHKLQLRQSQRRKGIVDTFDRCTYQVAIASMEGFTIPAQNFAATHRIPLIAFNKMTFWNGFRDILQQISNDGNLTEKEQEYSVTRFADSIASRMAVAITNSGQMLFLYNEFDECCSFASDYELFWVSPNLPWKLVSGNRQYSFQLPESILKQWLNDSTSDIERRIEAINCKENFMSNMVVYYNENGYPTIKMISIDKARLEEAKSMLK